MNMKNQMMMAAMAAGMKAAMMAALEADNMCAVVVMAPMAQAVALGADMAEVAAMVAAARAEAMDGMVCMSCVDACNAVENMMDSAAEM